MISITRDLRKDLEKTVKQARRIAEAGARQAVQQLRVGDGDAPKDLSTDQRELRTRLRAHGRQLGDRRDVRTGVQETARLVQECAYEQWHRMLFARFLAETDLLIEPQSGVAITLDEVQELAREKAADWLELASDYAERMLPQIFRKDDPVLEIALPPETRSEIEDLLKELPKPVFEAEDSLGWVYQFWQADRKQEINDAEVRIGANELPAVTQLFTEDYMVLFLLHNTLGAWWAAKVLAGSLNLARSAADEAALRTACALGNINWEYLRFVRDKDVDATTCTWRPAAGAFEGWPHLAKDITLLDPSMGSGHFLVFALPILVALRMAEEGLDEGEAVDVVLRDNLFGLEIDPRCTQIAAFNLAFAAWRRVGYRPLPQLNIACSGLAIGVTLAEWLKLGEKAVMAADPAAQWNLFGLEKNLLTVGLEERVKNGLAGLYDLFAKAPSLGSLIDPRRLGADIFNEGSEKLEPLLETIVAAADTDEWREMAVSAKGMAKATELLRRQFTLIVTNVPYLVRSKQEDVLKDFSDQYCRAGASDLATVFLRRCRSWGYSYATVLPQNWLYQKAYSDYRLEILKNQRIRLVGAIGSGATSTASWDVLRCLSVIDDEKPGVDQTIRFVDAESGSDNTRSFELRNSSVTAAAASRLLLSSGCKIMSGAAETVAMLSDYADSFQGIKSGDDARLKMEFWEVSLSGSRWQPLQSSVTHTCLVGGLSSVIDMTRDGALLARRQGLGGWGKLGAVASRMRDLPASFYWGTPFDSIVSAIIPRDPDVVAAVWAYCSSQEYAENVRKIDKSLAATNGSMAQVPFQYAHWQEVGKNLFGSEPPLPESDDPTQWFFHGAAQNSTDPLQVAVAQLVGFQWPTTVRDITLTKRCERLVRSGRESIKLADSDGIVCLSAARGEPPAVERLGNFLAYAFGQDWSAAKLSTILAEAGYAGEALDDWLRDGFFLKHCDVFHQRPFIWHVWDGRRDGFHALINFHQLAAPNGEGRRALEKLIFSYLGDWIDRQHAHQKAGIDGSDARLVHAQHLKTELIKILQGEPPYDIFVRWKPLREQPLGWDPDINDGVRVNIRPFISARTLNARGANACILRATPKIKWDKDRGKEPTRDKDEYPWFWGWDEATHDFAGGAEFDGNRWNNLHYSLSAKQLARDRRRASVGGKT